MAHEQPCEPEMVHVNVMEFPEHRKKRILDAVNHGELRAFLRYFLDELDCQKKDIENCIRTMMTLNHDALIYETEQMRAFIAQADQMRSLLGEAPRPAPAAETPPAEKKKVGKLPVTTVAAPEPVDADDDPTLAALAEAEGDNRSLEAPVESVKPAKPGGETHTHLGTRLAPT